MPLCMRGGRLAGPHRAAAGRPLPVEARRHGGRTVQWLHPRPLLRPGRGATGANQRPDHPELVTPPNRFNT